MSRLLLIIFGRTRKIICFFFYQNPSSRVRRQSTRRPTYNRYRYDESRGITAQPNTTDIVSCAGLWLFPLTEIQSEKKNPHGSLRETAVDRWPGQKKNKRAIRTTANTRRLPRILGFARGIFTVRSWQQTVVCFPAFGFGIRMNLARKTLRRETVYNNNSNTSHVRDLFSACLCTCIFA